MSVAHDLYEAIHRGTPGDLAFYRRTCEGARSVLELGCGHGRVLGALSKRDGHAELCGLERDEEMARRARARVPTATIVTGDMAALDLGRRFDRIIVPHSGLWCLPDDDALARTLAAVNEHLAPDGIFAFDAWNVDGFHRDADPAEYPLSWDEPLVAIASPDTTWTVWETSEWDREARRLVARYEHRADDGRVVRSEFVPHYVLRDALESAMRDAGLTPLIAGGFAGEPWTPDASSTVVTARRRRG